MTRRILRTLARRVAWLDLLVGPIAQPDRPRPPLGVDVDQWAERRTS